MGGNSVKTLRKGYQGGSLHHIPTAQQRLMGPLISCWLGSQDEKEGQVTWLATSLVQRIFERVTCVAKALQQVDAPFKQSKRTR